ncbi:hypothetical protein DSO57_1005678 [Entomophthora muscae]|uniref:Uncharacterized protein n=1 Tax=Entomophthora muscae TaxID=34485 RepID=A0ACC2RYZ6_9FUNG|nr:hypothetical protein DSO57_1005678 [Entomophthora muscae]
MKVIILLWFGRVLGFHKRIHHESTVKCFNRAINFWRNQRPHLACAIFKNTFYASDGWATGVWKCMGHQHSYVCAPKTMKLWLMRTGDGGYENWGYAGPFCRSNATLYLNYV